MGKLAKMGLGFGVINGGMAFYGARAEGHSKSASVAIAAGETALYGLLPGVAFARDMYGLAKGVGESGVFDRSSAQAKRMSMYSQGGNWNYQDTQQAATMRQRGLDAIQQSRMNARSAMGREARSLHHGAF
ncbi:hypothetical protein D3C85_480680 [compost metagenome]